MEKPVQLQDVFERYLNNSCSEEEVNYLLAYFETNNEHGELRELIIQQFEEDDVSELENQLEAQAALHRVELKLNNRISGKGGAIVRPLVPNRRSLRGLWAAASIAIVLTIAGLGYLYQKSIAPKQLELVTAKGQRKQLNLPDGTRVWLGPASKVSYPEQFKGAARNISIEGEAFFEVAQDANHPFVIESGELSTKVLGTSFNINAYKEYSRIEVTVLTGKVSVERTGSGNEAANNTILEANEQVTFDKTTAKLTKQTYLNAPKLLAQREGVFEYKGEKLQQVVEDMEMQYNITIKLSPALADKAFYGSLKATDGINQTLNKLCTVMEISWTQQGNFYILH